MKYIKRLKISDINLFKKILNNNDFYISTLEINYSLIVKTIKSDNFNDFKKEVDFIINSKNNKIENLKEIQNRFIEDLSSLAIDFASKLEKLTPELRDIITKSPHAIIRYLSQSNNKYAEIEGCENLFLNLNEKENRGYQTYFYQFFIEYYIPYLKTIHKQNYKSYLEKFKPQIYKSIHEFINHDGLNLILEIEEVPLKEDVFNKIFRTTKMINSFVFSVYLTEHLLPELEKKYSNKKQILDTFIKEDGEYHFIFKKLKTMRSSHGVWGFVNYLSGQKIPDELEDILSNNAENLFEYITQIKTTSDMNLVLRRFLIRLANAPSVILDRMVALSKYHTKTFIPLEFKEIVINHSSKYAYEYYNLALNNNLNNELDIHRDRIANILNKNISKDNLYSLTYLKSRIRVAKIDNKKLDVKKYIEENLSEVLNTILNSNNAKILLDFSKSTKIKLNSDLESFLRFSDESLSNEYWKIKFIK